MLKRRSFQPISGPITLILEYDEATISQIGRVLTSWQTLLRTAWTESYDLVSPEKPPAPHIVVSTASSKHSVELTAELAISLQVYVPNLPWEEMAKVALQVICEAWWALTMTNVQTANVRTDLGGISGPRSDRRERRDKVRIKHIASGREMTRRTENFLNDASRRNIDVTVNIETLNNIQLDHRDHEGWRRRRKRSKRDR